MEKQKKLTLRDYFRSLGPGAIMAAAIIGPGTVTTASTQGASYGYTSLWIILCACIIAYFFQEPGARIAIGCGENAMAGIREHIGKGWAIFLYIVVYVGAIAFQAGNLTGAAMALQYFLPGTTIILWAVVISLCGLGIALLNRYNIIENVNQVLIIMMVLAFLITAFTSGPSITDMVSEGFSFHIPGGNATLALSLLATTVTPNLVLGYSSFLRKKYPDVAEEEKRELIATNRFGLGFNMFVSFLITGAIIVCAATVLHPQGITISSAADMAQQLVPLLGRFAGVFFSLGLFAAAFSSVLYQLSLHNMLFPQAFGLKSEDPKAPYNMALILSVAIVPVLVIALSGSSPVSMIITAQALNGFALPLVFILCWILCNKKKFMGDYANNLRQNIVFGITTAFTLVFACNALWNNVILKIVNMLK